MGPRCLIIVCVVLLLAGCGGERRRPQTLDDFGNALTYFYQHPSQNEFSLICNEEPYHRREMAKASADEVVPVFVTVGERKYGYVIAKADDDPHLHGPFTAANVDDYLLSDENASPGQNDALWVAFFTSGDERYLDVLYRRATSVTTVIGPDGKPEVGPDGKPALVIDLTQTTAAWSYKANCRQHPAVLAHLRKQHGHEEFAKECEAWAAGKD